MSSDNDEFEKRMMHKIRRGQFLLHLEGSAVAGCVFGVAYAIFAGLCCAPYIGTQGQINFRYPHIGFIENAAPVVWSLVFNPPPFCLISTIMAGYLATRLAVFWSDAQGWKACVSGWLVATVTFCIVGFPLTFWLFSHYHEV